MWIPLLLCWVSSYPVADSSPMSGSFESNSLPVSSVSVAVADTTSGEDDQAIDDALQQQAPSLAIDDWPMVGQARLKVLFWNIYDSALYTPSGTWQGEGPYQLSLHYLRDIPVHQLIEQTDKAWREQRRTHPRQAEWLVQLADIWPDITEGDNLVLSVATSGHSGFWFNGEFIGAIQDEDFGPLFGGIWLDADSPQPDLRAKLIASQEIFTVPRDAR